LLQKTRTAKCEIKSTILKIFHLIKRPKLFVSESKTLAIWVNFELNYPQTEEISFLIGLDLATQMLPQWQQLADSQGISLSQAIQQSGLYNEEKNNIFT
jgi:hypothetical protein